jgi:hypothetical protein
MSKRKSQARLKKANSRKMAANAKQATVKTPRHSPRALAENSSALTTLTEREIPAVEVPVAPVDQVKQSGHEREGLDESRNYVPIAAESSTVLATGPIAEQEVPRFDISKLSHRERRFLEPETNGFGVFSAITTVQAYEAKLLEMYSANMQLAFECAVELFIAASELTSGRVRVFLEQSEQMTELLVRRSRGA